MNSITIRIFKPVDIKRAYKRMNAHGFTISSREFVEVLFENEGQDFIRIGPWVFRFGPNFWEEW